MFTAPSTMSFTLCSEFQEDDLWEINNIWKPFHQHDTACPLNTVQFTFIIKTNTSLICTFHIELKIILFHITKMLFIVHVLSPFSSMEQNHSCPAHGPKKALWLSMYTIQVQSLNPGFVSMHLQLTVFKLHLIILLLMIAMIFRFIDTFTVNIFYKFTEDACRRSFYDLINHYTMMFTLYSVCPSTSLRCLSVIMFQVTLIIII